MLKKILYTIFFFSFVANVIVLIASFFGYGGLPEVFDGFE